MPNNYLPISISIKNRRCLIVGGGVVALRKIETLLDYDTDLTVIAPKVDDKIDYYAGKKLLQLKKKEYLSPEASEYNLVISASDDKDANKTVYDDCQKAGIPVNVVDNPQLCDFIFPAILKRDCVTIAVSSDGRAPFLSGQLRLILEDLFPKHWNKIAKYAAVFRQKVRKRWKGKPQRKVECYERFLGADWKELTKKQSDNEIEQELDKMLESG